ncbi:M20 family metallopeptidase [Streptomonospora wellingtoniae]|uniref:M20 family metallopeptidase n=1 Tax=Streptomonospora wellingtoniae TaxID=3075544 RepID=A0ABU2KNJ5_9ACTN|nr:M20 family metallopeptidase [Streptomonospora sp. DSM 45055]MDT0300846.1 M20 family metallopeptidase [Streptomonospora sp. DSM 45055]
MPMQGKFTSALRSLVDAESPSADAAAVERCGDRLAEVGEAVAGAAPERIALADGPSALIWRQGDARAPGRVLLLGHRDTVWPLGTVAERPFAVEDGRARGPGVFDMKAGLLVALYAMAELQPQVPVTLLVTGDEEVGSAASRELIEAEARTCGAVLVLEGAAEGGALKRARKGWSIYTLRCRGRSAHAGLEPHKGRNALVRMSELVAESQRLGAPERGLTVTPTLARAGHTVNTVPDDAELHLDVRASTAADQRRADESIRRLAAASTGVEVHVEGGINRPPMEESATAALLERTERHARELGARPPESAAVGGISDANLVAALGIPVLDGLGAVGGGPHAEHEWVDVDATLHRIPLVSALVDGLAEHPLPDPEGM